MNPSLEASINLKEQHWSYVMQCSFESHQTHVQYAKAYF